MKTLCKTLIPTLALLSAPAFANDVTTTDSARDVKFELGVGLLFGGEELARMEYDDGTSSTVKAGAGITIYGGFVIPVKNQWSAQVRLGWLSDSTSGESYGGDTVEYYFQRLPLEGLARYDHGKHGFGFGVTKHLSPEFGIEVNSDSLEVDIDSGLGLVAEYQYKYGPSGYFGVKAQKMTYTLDGTDIDGDGIGITFGGLF